MNELPIEIIDKIMLYNRTKEADIVLHAISKMVELHKEKNIYIPRDILPHRYQGYWIEEDGSCSDPLWLYSVFLQWFITTNPLKET